MNRVIFLVLLMVGLINYTKAQNYPTVTSEGDYVEKYTKWNNGFEIGVANATNARRSWILTRHSDVPNFGKHYSTFHLQPDIGDKSYYLGVAIGYPASTHLPYGTHLAVNGKVGIGINNPRAKLDVNGSFYLGRSEIINGWGRTYFNYDGHSLIIGSKDGVYAHNRLELKPGGSDRGVLYSIFEMFQATDEGDQDLRVRLHSTGDSFFNGGNVGIGTTTPDSKLSVNGNIRAHEIKLETSNWPDYVFGENYRQLSLEQVKTFIKEHGHLPGLKSAEVYQKGGVDMMELNQKLVEKIEEMTLYQIQQAEEIRELRKMVEALVEREEER